MALEHQVGPEARRSRRALTLLELLVVLAIIGLLLAVLFPVLQAMRESARKTSCMNNLSQIGLALKMYSSENSGRLPPGWVADDDAGYPGWGWGSRILNELGNHNAEQQINSTFSSAESLKGKPNKPNKAKGKGAGRGKARGLANGLMDIDEAAPEFLVQQFGVYLCPSDADAPLTFTLNEDTSTLMTQNLSTWPDAAPSAHGAAGNGKVLQNTAAPQRGGQKPGQGTGPKSVKGPTKPGNGNNPSNGNPGNGNGPQGNGSPAGGSTPTSGSTAGNVLLTVSRSNYAGVFGNGLIDANPAVGDGAFYENSETMLERLDGNMTIIVGERTSDFKGTWTGAVPGAVLSRARVVGEASHLSFGDVSDFGSNHGSGAYFLYGSLAVKFLHANIDSKIYRALMSRHKEEKGVVPANFDDAP